MLASTAVSLGSLGSQLLNSPSHNPTKPFLLPLNKPLLKSPNSITSSSFLKSRTSVRTAVAAVDSSDAAVQRGQQAGGEGGSKSYHFVVANAKFMLDEEEHFQELMSERLRLYGERNMEQDFWLVIEPKFLDKFPNITKRLKRPAVALVSTNGPWITFMKLRLDRVLQDSFETDTLEEALASSRIDIEFEKPEKWTAPYAKYKYGWWEPFLPSKTLNV
ncbi:uncharacterized protein LOC121749514 isoform X1 [Salvia splendens]|uniref:uncharacterized protein LOC121749514 isoform X1 n=1 Tax=Salvia splendens TaxID=180675 RepID=UPI001C27BE46|nr:uncharacterized protein LOC121749514 isoform X1 [Salvia splendens]